MPAVARAVGAPTTSVYWHFRTRDDLLVAIAELAVSKLQARLPVIDLAQPWDEEAFAFFRAYRRELKRYPAFLSVFNSRNQFLFTSVALKSPLLATMEQGFTLFMQTGAKPVEAARAFMTCEEIVRGICTVELGLARERAVPRLRVDGLVDRVDASRFPTLAQIPDLDGVMWLDDAKFETALRALLAGILA